ncbi:sensor histidine kinase [Alkalilimnicola ehrlichii]|uniref:sensor histidine kinase n=1 Tax=Alkalilimnicola ehrlichii TaxID=351052 RepID=UPI003BA31DFA
MTTARANDWAALQVFCGYRLVVVLALLLLFIWARGEPLLLAVRWTDVFLATLLAYLAWSVVALWLQQRRVPAFSLQLYAQLGVDVLALSLLVAATGRMDGGLALLVLIVVAGGSLMLANLRLALGLAAMATLALLAVQGFVALYADGAAEGYTLVGMYGMGLFLLGAGGSLLAIRVRTAQALAERRGVDLANMQALNEHIVQHMEPGVVVVDGAGIIRLLNHSAMGWLASGRGAALEHVAPALDLAVRRWRRGRVGSGLAVPVQVRGAEVRVNISALGPDPEGPLLLLLEDQAELHARVQQAKLAALGRLTASIAHEIRNPLSAILHAGQLLAESPDLSEDDRRLLDIVRRHGRRLNTIVEDVQQLSRRGRARREAVALDAFLEEFLQRWGEQRGREGARIHCRVTPAGLLVLFDPNQLHQVVTNLVENAVRHASDGRPRVTVTLSGRQTQAGEAWLEVCDDGPGVGRDIANSVFEPFFTSQPSGSGLGLFICRELCESNRADLRLINPGEPGACFRLTLQMAPAGVPAGWQEPETEVRLSRFADGDGPAPAARR